MINNKSLEILYDEASQQLMSDLNSICIRKMRFHEKFDLWRAYFPIGLNKK